MDFTNKTVVITGATGGLGEDVVRKFLKTGATVAAIARSQSKLQALHEKFETHTENLYIFSADVTQEPDVQRAFEQIKKQLGPVYALVHAAGGFQGGTSVANIVLEDWQHILDLNLKSTFLCCKYALKQMISEKRGKIVAISALAALDSAKNRGGYLVSKAGINALIRAIAQEEKENNIQANAIAPSIILTEANKQAMPEMDASKWVTPQQIAETVAFLCSTAANSLTGTIIRMPGKM